MAEAEIAVYFRSEVHPDCPHEDLLQNIEAIGSAIEIVDVDASTDNLEAILAKEHLSAPRRTRSASCLKLECRKRRAITGNGVA
jgi:hypothetical protein